MKRWGLGGGGGGPATAPGVRPSLRSPSSSAPSTWGPRRPATWGDASPDRPGRSAPGWLWPHRAPAWPAAPTCPLPGPAAPTSSWAPRRLLLPSQARGVRRGPATGGTCAPQIRIRETVPAPCRRGGGGCGCAGGALCAGTCSGCVPYKKQNIFYTLKKKCSFLLPGSRRGYF